MALTDCHGFFFVCAALLIVKSSVKCKILGPQDRNEMSQISDDGNKQWQQPSLEVSPTSENQKIGLFKYLVTKAGQKKNINGVTPTNADNFAS